MSIVQQIELKRINVSLGEDGKPLNPRGFVTNTTDLQESMRIAGQSDSIQVWIDADGDYVLIDGHRRVTAARELGWDTIRAEIREIEKPDTDTLLASMLASNVRANYKPSALGKSIRLLAMEFHWGLERVAKLCGMTADKAQLLVDLIDAPESVQRRVDSGDMSLSAWKMLRDKPREVQERAAELDNPTVIRCRIVAQEAQQTPPGGVMAAMLDQMSAEHTLVAALGEARARLLSEWHKLTEAERTRAAAVVEAMSAFIGARADAQMEGA